jgi:hypothetical protein
MKIELCVIPPRTKDWLLHLWWLPSLAEDPRVERITIYSSMIYDTTLECGVKLVESYKLNTGRYLLHMVSDLLNQETAGGKILFCSVSVTVKVLHETN